MTASTFTVTPDGVAHFKRGTKSELPPKKPKDRLAWLVKRGHIEAESLELGERILKLSEAKKREPSPHQHFDQGAGGGGSNGGGALGRVSARQKWDRLFAVVGPKGEAVINAVIVDGMSLGDAAEAMNIHPKAVLHLLQFALDVLGRA